MDVLLDLDWVLFLVWKLLGGSWILTGGYICNRPSGLKGERR